MAISEIDISFDGINVHCYVGGSGFPIVLVHGSGPGTASASNWGRVLEPLSGHYRVCAMDLIGYGLSGRKPKEPYFDIDLWVRQVRFVLNYHASDGQIGLVGHSLGGAISLRAALLEPRVSKLLLQGSLGAPIKLNQAIDVSWGIPKDLDAFRRFYRDIIQIRGEISDEFLKQRLATVRKDGYDKYFTSMYSGDKQKYLDLSVVPKDDLKKLKCEVLLVHGDTDTCVPFEEGGVPLASSLPDADLVRLSHCGHPCSFDVPEKFLKYSRAFFG